MAVIYNCVRCWQNRVLYGSWVSRVLSLVAGLSVMRKGLFLTRKSTETPYLGIAGIATINGTDVRERTRSTGEIKRQRKVVCKSHACVLLGYCL